MSTYMSAAARRAEESVVRRLREEYVDLMRQGRLEAAQNVLAAHDRALLRLRSGQ